MSLLSRFSRSLENMNRERAIYLLLGLAFALLLLAAYYAEEITPWIERLTRPNNGILP